MAGLVVGPLKAQTTELAQLESAMREELGDKPPRSPDEKRYDDGWERRAMNLVQLRPTFSRAANNSEIDSILSQVELNYHSEKVRQSLDKFRAALQAQREAKEKAVVAEVEAVLARVAETVVKARGPAELDDLVRDLNRLMDRRDTYEKHNLNERIRSVRQFTIYWQDYLDHLAAGRLDQAERSLQDANGVTPANMIPRSDILARLSELKKRKEPVRDQLSLPGINDIMAKTKTLADLPAAIDALTNLKASSKDSGDASSPVATLLRELTNLQVCYDDFKAGLPAVLSLAHVEGVNQSRAASLVLPLKIELLRMVIPRFLRIDQAPGKDEPLDDYIARIMQLALERGDARLIMRVYDLRNLINSTPQSLQLSPALFTLLAAQNQEEAGQFGPAVISYQKALRTGVDLVPAKAIGARLDAIKASHPAEYDAAMKLFLAQPDPAPPPSGNFNGYSLKIPGSDPQSPTPHSTLSPTPH